MDSIIGSNGRLGRHKKGTKATHRIRTDDLLITSELLYQLS